MELTKREREQIYFRQKWKFSPEIPFCINCEHFYQHYIKAGPPIFTVSMQPLDCGHCSYPRMKHREAYDTCEYFENKNHPRQVVAHLTGNSKTETHEISPVLSLYQRRGAESRGKTDKHST